MRAGSGRREPAGEKPHRKITVFEDPGSPTCPSRTGEIGHTAPSGLASDTAPGRDPSEGHPKKLPPRQQGGGPSTHPPRGVSSSRHPRTRPDVSRETSEAAGVAVTEFLTWTDTHIERGGWWHMPHFIQSQSQCSSPWSRIHRDSSPLAREPRARGRRGSADLHNTSLLHSVIPLT